MKLREQFEKLEEFNEDECVKIAENFAIWFSVWLDKNKKENKGLLIEELLEIYKKTL